MTWAPLQFSPDFVHLPFCLVGFKDLGTHGCCSVLPYLLDLSLTYLSHPSGTCFPSRWEPCQSPARCPQDVAAIYYDTFDFVCGIEWLFPSEKSYFMHRTVTSYCSFHEQNKWTNVQISRLRQSRFKSGDGVWINGSSRLLSWPA